MFISQLHVNELTLRVHYMYNVSRCNYRPYQKDHRFNSKFYLIQLKGRSIQLLPSYVMYLQILYKLSINMDRVITTGGIHHVHMYILDISISAYSTLYTAYAITVFVKRCYVAT